MRPIYLLLAALLLLGCSPQAAPQETLRLAISPAAYPVAQAVMACLPADDSVAVTIDSPHPSEVDLSEYNLYIHLGRNTSAEFAALIATEQIVLAINPAQGLTSFSALQAADLLSGRVRDWAQLGGRAETVLLFIPPDSDEALQAFRSNVVRGAFSGQALIATSPDTLLQNVAINPSAAGILPAAWADDSVNIFDYKVSLPVLALAAQVPQGAARSLLACLQGPTGQAILADIYP